MRHRQLPPTIHFNEVNPHIHFEETPFYLVDRLQEWQSDGPRRATVSAFSFGGVNAHLVVEEPPAAVPAASTDLRPGASGHHPGRDLRHGTGDHGGAPGRAPGEDTGPRPWPTWRSPSTSAATTSTGGSGSSSTRWTELRRELGRASERIGGADRAEGQRRRRKTRQPAYVFGGDGEAQSVKSAALALASAEPDARALFDQAEALVGALSPAATLYVLQVALARLWESWGVKAQAVAGRRGCARGGGRQGGALVRGRAAAGPGRRLERPRRR